MTSVTVTKSALLKALTTNRKIHEQLYQDAMKGYRKERIKELKRFLELAEAGKDVPASSSLQVPVTRTADYDKAIAMIKMSVDAKIELNHTEFDNYVLDNWNWKNNVMFTNSFYASQE